MKILMVLMSLDIGGAETHVAELTRALCRQGHQVVLVSAGGVYAEQLKAEGVRHEFAPLDRRDPRLMLRSLRILRRIIRREKPDLVHAHARIPAFLCGILRRWMDFPFITTAHWVFQVTPLLRLATDWGSRTVAVSEDIKTYLMTEYQVPEDQIQVTINGIDTDAYDVLPRDSALRQKLGLGDGPVVGLVSRLDDDRYLAAQLLIESMERLRERFPGVQLLLVGGGEREAELKQRAEQINAGCGGLIVMTGAQTNVPELLAQCDVFVGVSRAALEAMAAGKPVILAGNEGFMGLFRPHMLESAMESNFCCRGDYPMVSEALLLESLTEALSMSPREWEVLGAYGRKMVMERYSVARMTSDYLSAYDRLLHPVRPVWAVISGYYGYGNLGDDAILQAISRQLSGMEPPVRLTVLSKTPKETRRRFGLPAVSRFSPVAMARALRRSDVLISGGGSLLQDRTSNRSLLYYLWVIWLAKLLRKPVFLYANGIGPVIRRRNRRRVRRCVESCAGATLRDANSLAELRAMGVTREDIQVASDPALCLTADRSGPERLSAVGVPGGKPMVGVSLRPVRGQDDRIGQFAAFLDRVSRDADREIVFLVMQEPGDREISLQVQARMREPSWILEPMDRPGEMLSVIRQMDLIISMRLHTIIFAAGQRVPVVGCDYDPKVTAFLQMLDMPSCGTPDALDPNTAYAVVREVLDHREEKAAQLDTLVREMEREAARIPELFQETLRRERIVQSKSDVKEGNHE